MFSAINIHNRNIQSTKLPNRLQNTQVTLTVRGFLFCFVRNKISTVTRVCAGRLSPETEGLSAETILLNSLVQSEPVSHFYNLKVPHLTMSLQLQGQSIHQASSRETGYFECNPDRNQCWRFNSLEQFYNNIMKAVFKQLERVITRLPAQKFLVPFQKTSEFLKKSVLHRPPRIRQLYEPTLYLSNPLTQVVYNIMEKNRKLPYQREKLFFKDGGHVSLDWHNQDISKGNFKVFDDETPICFVMHGLTGGSEMNYIKVLLEAANKNNFRGVCLNGRGIGSDMTSPIPFTWIGFQDLEAALQHIQKKYPRADIYMIGTSFGSNYLTRYMLQNTGTNNIKGYVGLGTPFDVPTVMKEMSPICQKFFVKRYINQTVGKHQMMKHWEREGLIRLSQMLKVSTLSQFYQQMLPLTGLPNVQQLFKVYSIGEQIRNLKVPSLFINSHDDPIVTTKGIPYQAIRSNPNIKYLETQAGGHLCWYQGVVPRRWYPKPTFSFLNSLVKP